LASLTPPESKAPIASRLERQRADRRRELDGIVALLPLDLADGMSTLAYLAGISEREAERRRRGRKAWAGRERKTV